MILASVALPLLLALILVGMDMRSDLSGLKPAQAGADQAQALIGWPDLDPRDGHPAQTRWPSQTRIKMLGYMMDGYMMDGYTASPDGALVSMFILMPEAGHFLHPAHHIPEEMVEVWLSRQVSFKYRSLIWVSGVLGRSTGPSTSGTALFAIRDAKVEPATETDITRSFTQ